MPPESFYPIPNLRVVQLSGVEAHILRDTEWRARAGAKAEEALPSRLAAIWSVQKRYVPARLWTLAFFPPAALPMAFDVAGQVVHSELGRREKRSDFTELNYVDLRSASELDFLKHSLEESKAEFEELKNQLVACRAEFEEVINAERPTPAFLIPASIAGQQAAPGDPANSAATADDQTKLWSLADEQVREHMGGRTFRQVTTFAEYFPGRLITVAMNPLALPAQVMGAAYEASTQELERDERKQILGEMFFVGQQVWAGEADVAHKVMGVREGLERAKAEVAGLERELELAEFYVPLADIEDGKPGMWTHAQLTSDQPPHLDGLGKWRPRLAKVGNPEFPGAGLELPKLTSPAADANEAAPPSEETGDSPEAADHPHRKLGSSRGEHIFRAAASFPYRALAVLATGVAAPFAAVGHFLYAWGEDWGIGPRREGAQETLSKIDDLDITRQLALNELEKDTRSLWSEVSSLRDEVSALRFGVRDYRNEELVIETVSEEAALALRNPALKGPALLSRVNAMRNNPPAPSVCSRMPVTDNTASPPVLTVTM